MNKTVQIITPLVILIIVGMTPFKVECQQFIQPLLNDPYVKVLFQVLDTWDAGKLIIEKREVEKDFIDAIKRRNATPISAFEKSEQYIPEVTKRWETLPKTLTREKALTLGARMVLAGPLYDHREEVAMVVREPGQLQVRLRMELFVVLAAGQLEAIRQDLRNIDGTSILRGYSAFWSIPWPFCCWKVRR